MSNFPNYKLINKVDDLLYIQTKFFKDERGFFNEFYNDKFISQFVPKFKIKQISLSQSKKNVFRGMHFQLKPNISKIMRVIKGKAVLLAIDISKKNNKKIISSKVIEDPSILIWAPAHYARGFISLAKETTIEYLQSGYFNVAREFKITLPNKKIIIDYLGSDYKMNLQDKEAITIDEWYKSYYDLFFK